MQRCRAPRLRIIAQFAEAELVVPTGPYAYRRFSREYQPFSGLCLDALAEAHRTGRFNRFALTGPRQTGKSILGCGLPAMYHLFEVQETTILAAPSLDMAADKWREDLKPLIEVSRYRDLLPRAGAASKGGTPRAVRFGNGRTLRFMTGGGGDKSRVGFNSRVLIITEADHFDTASETSREADKFSQLEGCLASFGRRAVVYLECTASIPEGLIWKTYQSGTASRIVRPCPHCRKWVTPEREHLRGWHEAENELQARRDARFVCPECSQPWTEEQRQAANRRAKLLHRGQTIDQAGTIDGEPPETLTLGFRWSAVDNHFRTAGDVAADEWKACARQGPRQQRKEDAAIHVALPSSRRKLTCNPSTGTP